MNATTLSISPWGNSHGIRLSRELMQAMHITPDTPLQVQVIEPGRLELRSSLKNSLWRKNSRLMTRPFTVAK